ncbi:FadR/GntR family transcriptional regulator [Pedobacter nyackensis]|uniref:DNA-binding transcriptional regulator, FadR family n=1 Tax=Pedobacter nyackensis TaxID=475255 RepID=A0A1W2C2B2_9SPHI|nr:GntR family transcriptional regulator [Pedobacter nyackensis]SMC79300.1 DNA-binding transcriptional regulator, FadR family [Pedobacter nyackensis]
MAINDLSKDLAPISSNTMADIVEIKLREYLKKKSFRPGDALPKELELAEALGISRNVLREALSRLRMLGMIETKKKRGMILARPDILGSFERVLDPLIIDNNTLQDIFELRLVLEMGLADLLYIRKTDKDVEELENIAKKEAKLDESFRIKSEIAFHGKLYDMTGNDTLKRFQIMLMPIFDYVLTQEKKPIRGKVNHMDLVQILKTGTKEDFKIGMQAHLQPHFDRINKIKTNK